MDSQRFRQGYLSQEERRKLAAAMHELYESPLIIDDRAGVTLMDVHSKLRRLKAKYGKIGFAGIDYLQLMGSQRA